MSKNAATEHDIIPASWRDGSSPFTDFSFDHPESLDETTMKEKRGSKRMVEAGASAAPAGQDRSSFVLDSVALSELSLSGDPTGAPDSGPRGREMRISSYLDEALGGIDPRVNVQSQLR